MANIASDGRGWGGLTGSRYATGRDIGLGEGLSESYLTHDSDAMQVGVSRDAAKGRNFAKVNAPSRKVAIRFALALEIYFRRLAERIKHAMRLHGRCVIIV